MGIEQDRRTKKFLMAFGIKAKKHESPRRMAYRKIEALTKNRRGTRSINEYLDAHISFMDVVIAAHDGMRTGWTAEHQAQLQKAIEEGR